MARYSLVLNVVRGVRVDRTLAQQAVDACAAIWIERGKTFRDVSEDEAIALRNQQAKQSERLCRSELKGVFFDHPGVDEEFRLVGAALEFLRTGAGA